jgi:hypothetical protein
VSDTKDKDTTLYRTPGTDLVKNPADYRWSSDGAFLNAKNQPAWLSIEFLLAYFGEKSSVAQKNFKVFVECQESKEDEDGDAIHIYKSSVPVRIPELNFLPFL